MRHRHPHRPQAARGDPPHRYRQRFLRIRIAAALLAALLMSTAWPAAAFATGESPGASSGTGSSTPDSLAIPEGNFQSMWPGRSCEFEAQAHRVHPSTVKGKRHASVHAYWNHLSGECPARATVTANLQAKLCADESGNNCWYQTMVSKTRRLRLGGGTNHETVAKYRCGSSNQAHWRVYVVAKVEIDNWFDKYATYTSDPVRLPCRIY